MGRPNDRGQSSRLPDSDPGNPNAAPGEQFYRALVENAGDILTILDNTGTITYQSPAVRKVMGASEQLLIGRPIVDLVHPDDRERLAAKIEECICTPGAEPVPTIRPPHASGSWRRDEARARNLLDDPNVAGILCTSRDVTDAYRMEHQLREAEQLARFGHWRWVKGEPAPHWSGGVARILGLEEQQLPAGGDWYEHLVHPEDRDELLSKFLDAFETHEPVTCTTRFRSGGHTYRYIKTYAYAEPDASNEIGALVGLAEDVNEEVEAELALKASEAKYRLMTEQASDVMTHCDARSRVIFISPAIGPMLGRQPEELIGSPISRDLIHPDDYEKAYAAFIRCALKGEQVQFDYRFLHKDGHYVWLESTMRSAYDADGIRTGEVISITRNVSERKQHEIEILEARERAETASRTKSRFLANMSHELRTPLNAIIGFSEILRMQMFGDLGHSRYMEYAQLINESGALLLDLISDILDMSKIEAGKYELHPEAIKIGGLVDACIRLVRGRAEENGVLLVKHVESGPSGGELMADERALKQILLNLLSNSVKFTPTGGRISIGVIEADGMIRLSVTDNGRGIPQDQIERLGQPFEQIATDAALSKEGTGLGLALVRSLAELHGGSMTIESELGAGTTVTVAMPLVPSCLSFAMMPASGDADPGSLAGGHTDH
ncbi:MAG: PAS domain S-box protein [Parvibaculum sp.]|nr:PAS domain S-box protein [Parvibaculum sp.]